MISFATVKSAAIQNLIRILTVIQYGAKTAPEAASFGEDSCPPAGYAAVYAKTDTDGSPVILGFINKSALAQVGEKRIYALRPDGTLSTYAWLHNDGTMELAGSGNNLVRYTALNEALSNQDTLIQAELVKIEAAIASLGGAYVPGEITTDISASKINEIKCI